MEKKDRVVIEITVIVLLIGALWYYVYRATHQEKEQFNAQTMVLPKSLIDIGSGYRTVMGTFARVVAVAEDSAKAKNCIDVAFAEFDKVDKLMSRYKKDSEISEINRDGFKRAVQVSKPTFEVLKRASEISELTEGAFDITVGVLSDLWQAAKDANSVPDEAALQQARSKVDYEKLILDVNDLSVRFAVEGMKLDTGGIAKGYAIDKAVEAMQACGVNGGMIDIGGDIRCFGSPPSGKETWLIALQNPEQTKSEDVTEQYLSVLKIKDEAITTSGDYQRFFVIKGKRYSHIIDTKVGWSSNKVSSVTIIGKNAIDADALATAVSVMGIEKGLALIESIDNTEAILIPAKSRDQLIKTKGAQQYLLKMPTQSKPQ